MKTHIFQIEMTCEGCSNAVTNVLNKHKDKGISKFVVNLKEKTVEVESSMTVEEIQEILKKTGKSVSYVKEK